MKRAALWFLGAWAATSTLSCGGVTQPLGDAAGGAAGSQASPPSDAPSSDAPPSIAGSSSGGSVNTTHPCETECVRQVFTGSVASCKLCHGGTLQTAALDLESPHVTSRLKDVPAQHIDLPPPMSDAECPVGDLLIDTAYPENSWLLKKIRGQQGSCGTAMPQTGPLRPAEQQCIATYVACVAAR